MYGPDITFLGVDRCDVDDREALRAADAVILGAPYDAGASYRAGARFGPQSIRMTDYLPHDGSRPHLALRVDPLRDLTVLDAGDVEMAGVEGRAPLTALERAVQAVGEAGAFPLILGGETTPSPGRTSPGWPAPSAGDVCRSSTSTRTPTPGSSSSAASSVTGCRCDG